MSECLRTEVTSFGVERAGRRSSIIVVLREREGERERAVCVSERQQGERETRNQDAYTEFSNLAAAGRLAPR